MTPPCLPFPASELPRKVQEDAYGRRRKHAPSTTQRVDLNNCELFEMLSYKCEVKNPEVMGSPVECHAFDRLFRKCKDRKGTFTVETTAWEHDREAKSQLSNGSNKPQNHYQWSSSWHDDDSPS